MLLEKLSIGIRVEKFKMIKFTVKGDFSKSRRFFQRALELIHNSTIDKYGKIGVKALSENTPIDTGLLASSWGYKIVHEKSSIRIDWYNTDVENYCPIAVILQYGHATRNGGYVEGKDYINSAMYKVFKQIADDAWKELVK